MANRDGSGSLGTLLAGAVLGAAGLAWWLLSETERRRQSGRSGHRYAALDAESLEEDPEPRPLRERELQDKVHQLNQAIDDVRRQLESLSPQS